MLTVNTIAKRLRNWNRYRTHDPRALAAHRPRPERSGHQPQRNPLHRQEARSRPNSRKGLAGRRHPLPLPTGRNARPHGGRFAVRQRIALTRPGAPQCSAHENHYRTHPRRRRRPRRIGSRLADRPGRRPRGPARDAPGARHRRSQDGQPRRTGLLEFVPLGRFRTTMPSACCMPRCGAWVRSSWLRRRQSGAGRRRARGRPGRLRRSGHGRARTPIR